MPKSGVIIQITGGKNTADARAAENAIQAKFAALINTDAAAIKSFYDGL